MISDARRDPQGGFRTIRGPPPQASAALPHRLPLLRERAGAFLLVLRVVEGRDRGSRLLVTRSIASAKVSDSVARATSLVAAKTSGGPEAR